MKLSKKLYLGFGIPLVTLCIVGFYAIYSFNRINYRIQTIYDDRVVPLSQLKQVSDNYAIRIIDAVNKANANQISLTQALVSVQQAQIEIERNWQAYIQTDLTHAEENLVQEIQRLFIQANPEIENLEQVLRTGDRTTLDRLDGELYLAIDPITQRIDQLTELQLKVASQERQIAGNIYRETLLVFIPLLIVAILVGSPAGFIIIRRGITAALQEVIDVIAVSSSEIDSIAQEQERIISQQAVSVTQTKMSIDELSQTAKTSAQQAQSTVNNATNALELSEAGNQAAEHTLEDINTLNQQVNMMATKIGELKQHAQEIASISELVSNLGNQTNMLALNAAVEAVRAGEYGSGFGVVAAEIRKLADESRESAVKINHLVNEIQGAIADTVTIADRGKVTVQTSSITLKNTAQSFLGVTQSIQEVFVNNQETSLSSQQQEQAIAQILQAINELNTAAKISTDGISQLKSGTEQLKIAAEHLKLMV
ncbi:methyl-accepting chemotaxis protein [Roseofilum sp. BLCC_M91]|uniref:Methyl-accepting chemotaxis protein n=1 Tax=Roseofilum halophilum BLCC-M91 TaxID=3022259 RepID=A0ABT7BF46_9CYAN|nr:methyl-accepting chemotaxis protein [Roseofilum halophilum]MDJ1177791.1 methyl-accepting chemotaxis protein [Roseofilum halophilum BLCC-M91]